MKENNHSEEEFQTTEENKGKTKNTFFSWLPYIFILLGVICFLGTIILGPFIEYDWRIGLVVVFLSLLSIVFGVFVTIKDQSRNENENENQSNQDNAKELSPLESFFKTVIKIIIIIGMIYFTFIIIICVSCAHSCSGDDCRDALDALEKVLIVK